jgi:hypothetical protein
MRPTDPRVRHHSLPCLTFALLLLANGCVTTAPPAPSTAVRDNLGVVAIVPAQFLPDSNFSTFAKGKVAGAAKGAAIGGGTTAVAFAAGAAAAGPVMPFIVLAGVLTTAAMTTAGAVEGAQQAVSTAQADEIESVINKAVAALDAQRAAGEQLTAIVKAERSIRLAAVNAAGPDSAAARPAYAQLQSSGIDTVLEVSITKVGFESCGPETVRRLSDACAEEPGHPLVDLFITAQARLVRVSDGKELFVRGFRYVSPRREIPRWVASDGRLLASEFEYAYRELAERVRDELLLATPIALPAHSSFGEMPGARNPLYGICWLAPVYPKPEPVKVTDMFVLPFSRPAGFCPASGLFFSVIDTLRPTLRWSAFPRELDRSELDPAALRQIGAVTYELKIWEAEGCERGRLIYERTGLAAPEHLLEDSLQPATRYFWSMRARFALDGRPTATRWAHFDVMNCFPNDITDWQYHRFVTPRQVVQP